jgi:Tfp pilus assembly protein PilF
VSEEIGNKFGIARSLNNIGLYYSHTGDIPQAFDYYQKSLRIHEEIGNKPSISTLHKNIAQLYKLQGNYSMAIEYYTKSLEIAEEMDDKRLTAAVLNELGESNSKQKNYNQAAAYCKRALQIGQSIGNPESIKGASGNLSEIYSAQGKYKEAYQMHVLFKQMSDSVSNVETRKSTVKKEMQYEFDRREAALKAEHEKKDVLAAAEIKRQTVIRNFTFAGVGLAGIFSFFLMRSYNRRKKITFDKQVSEVEMKALRSQMNPHFIFNSLNSINRYVKENDKDNASEYLSKFAKLMRLVLENSREQEVPLEDDLEALELFMQLESLRFQNRFQYVIQVDPGIDKENTLIPPLLLQPFVENSIIHGLPGKEGGLIKISVNKEENMIRCVVEDNGIGREQSVKIESSKEKKRESLGMKITQERLRIIDQLKNLKTAINIFDLKDAENKMSGLRVELLLPFEEAF